MTLDVFVFLLGLLFGFTLGAVPWILLESERRRRQRKLRKWLELPAE